MSPEAWIVALIVVVLGVGSLLAGLLSGGSNRERR